MSENQAPPTPSNSPSDYLELWLIRHGETLWNRHSRIQGNSNAPLSDLGQAQAKALAKRLEPIHFDAIYASDLDRAMLTAQLALPKARIIADKRLREIHLGDFEGRYVADLNPEELKSMRIWYTGPYEERVPGGESSNDLQARMLSWLADLPHKTGRVVAFSHGGAIAHMLQSIIGRPSTKAWQEQSAWSLRLDNTSISKLWLSATHKTIKVINDSAHLESMSE